MGTLPFPLLPFEGAFLLFVVEAAAPSFITIPYALFLGGMPLSSKLDIAISAQRIEENVRNH